MLHATFQARHLRSGDRIHLDGAEHEVSSVETTSTPTDTITIHTRGGGVWHLFAGRLVNTRRTP